MASLPLPFQPAVLAQTDASNRPLGLSPSKPLHNTPRSLSSSVGGGGDKGLNEASAGFVGFQATQGADGVAYTIASRQSIAILLGRAKSDDEFSTLGSEAMVPQGLALGSTPIQRVALPSLTKHVSRDHAIIFHSPFGSSWAIKILGQNGLIVNDKRRRAGLILRLVPGQTTLDFFGIKCLFVGGPTGEEKQGLQKRQQLMQSGESPRKRDSPSVQTSLGTIDGRSSLPALSRAATPLQRITATPIKVRRLVGNPLKRPLGAPLSPPTSSPAPFDHSSPVKMPRGQRRGQLASSSPALNKDEEDESSDESYEDPRGSPSLARRSARHDDSGILLPVKERLGSEDEASMALKAGNKNTSNGDADDQPESWLGDGDLTSSPNLVTKRLEKQVKFAPRNSPKVDTRERMTSGSGVLRIGGPAVPSSFEKVHNHVRKGVAQLAETYDLQGLLAGAIVFHRTATISATEAVRSVLTSNPGLLRGEFGPEGSLPVGAEKGKPLAMWTFAEIVAGGLVEEVEELDKERVELWQKKAWRERLEECLMEGECFGIISRAGKDASGNPLECWYYYDKEHDPGQ